jgi:hypothetical protein
MRWGPGTDSDSPKPLTQFDLFRRAITNWHEDGEK